MKEYGGAGVEPPSSASLKGVLQDDFSDLLTEGVLSGLRSAFPSYWDMAVTPREVLALSVLWRGAPIRYVKLAGGGFSWQVNATWARNNAERYERFMRVATGAPMVWDWLYTHVDAEIDSRNFLNLLGAA